jgi:glutamate carboxypeptidase
MLPTLWCHDRHRDGDSMDRFESYVAERREEVLAFLASLVDINSFTGNRDGVNRVGDLVAAFLRGLGFDETRTTRTTIGDHRCLRRPGPGRQVIFSCHLDTVFPPEQGFLRWERGEPLSRGPGVIDMKGGITVLCQTLAMLERLELRPRSGYTVFLAADEETGSEDARPLLEKEAQGKDYGLVFECGGARGEVVSARKGVGTFRLDLEGRAAHAGNDYAVGINANLEAAHQLIAIQGLTDLAAGTTVNVGQVSGGIGANTISPSAQLVVDVRFTAPGEADRVVAALEQRSASTVVPGARARLSGRIQRPVMVETAATRALIELVREASGGVIEAERRGGVSDANLIAALGVPTLDGFGPSGGKDHTPEEFMVTSSLFDRIALLGRVLTRLDS